MQATGWLATSARTSSWSWAWRGCHIVSRRQVHDFTSLGICSKLTALLAEKGIVSPSPVQTLAIPTILAGKNCAVQSYTGSGKTLAYLLPAAARAIAERAQPGFKNRSALALVVAPSRELCMQILRTAQGLLPISDTQQLIGGANPKRQHEALRRNKPMLVVGTPGRLLDMISSGALQVGHCPLLILDEVDVLSAAELHAETSRVVAAVGKQLDTPRQTVLVSASLSPQLAKSMEGWCPGAEYISTHDKADPAVPGVAPPALSPEPAAQGGAAAASMHGDVLLPQQAVEDKHFSQQSRARSILPPGLQHYYVLCDRSESSHHLARCMKALGVQRAIVFAGSQRNAMLVMSELEAKRVQVTVLHSQLSKLERSNILSAFSRGVFRAIVVTDLASRGLDFPELDAVFNLGVPEDDVDYAHRAGRTNRLGGVEGKVVSIVSSHDLPSIERTARRLGIQIQPAATSFGQFVSGGQVQAMSKPHQ